MIQYRCNSKTCTYLTSCPVGAIGSAGVKKIHALQTVNSKNSGSRPPHMFYITGTLRTSSFTNTLDRLKAVCLKLRLSTFQKYIGNNTFMILWFMVWSVKKKLTLSDRLVHTSWFSVSLIVAILVRESGYKCNLPQISSVWYGIHLVNSNCRVFKIFHESSCCILQPNILMWPVLSIWGSLM